MTFYTTEQIETVATATHEVNRAWCRLIGDDSQPAWAEAPEWQRESAIEGVKGVIQGNTPAESHATWLEHKQADGWVYGETKDPDAKTHPCMLPYEELPPEQRYKDSLFVKTATALLEGAANVVA